MGMRRSAAGAAAGAKGHGSEGTASRNAEGAVFGLLLRLVSLEDLRRSGVAIRGGIRVGDSDIKDRRGASGPEAVDSDVASEFWGGLGAVGARRLHVLTRLDEGSSETVEGVRLSAKLSPRRHEVVVAVEDQPSLRQDMACSVVKRSPHPSHRVERCWRQAEAEADAVSELFVREVGAVEKARQGGEPGAGRRRPYDASLLQWTRAREDRVQRLA
ncbi:hypothetical protein MHU86_8328 [Fragilaria crotonensis]|nr:hypothetical protein MHU86_8328 [Fragilaria crotonensis]